MLGGIRSQTRLGDVGRLLLDGSDAYRAREAVVFRNRRGERRVSWLVHDRELVVLRREADRSGMTMSGVVRRWWSDGLPVLVDPVVLCGDQGGVDGVCASSSPVFASCSRYASFGVG